jgi:AcrR family transcriptional regulator
MPSPSAPDHTPPPSMNEARAQTRDAVRQVRQAGRDAIRQAREAARLATRESLEVVRETMRQAREAEAEAARAARASGDRRGGKARSEGADPEVDTRTRIQRTALDLFTERGYEATSLREIAEALGVTKAALYYHFKTKEEILDSLILDRLAKIEELIAWAAEQPRSAELRREFVRRYSNLLYEQGHHGLMRFFERNQSSMGHQRAGAIMKERMLQMLDLITDPDAPLPAQIRCSLAIFALHSTWFTVRDPDISDDRRREAALEVALDLIS